MIKSIGLSMSLLVFGLFVAETSNAELTSSIKIRIRNSSNYIYPCNAGVGANSRATNRGVDYIRSSWVASENNPRAVSGSGTAVGGQTNAANPDPDRLLLSSLLTGNKTYPSFNELLPEATMYDYVIGRGASGNDRFEINLASDTYDSSYYVTFCFKPSLVTNPQDGIQSNLTFRSAKVTHSVVPGTLNNYANDSGLKAMVELKCVKDHGKVVQHYTPNGNTELENMLVPFSSNTTLELMSGGGISVGDPLSLISGGGIAQGDLPDACRFRFYFFETTGKLRPHVLTESDIQIDLDATVSQLGN